MEAEPNEDKGGKDTAHKADKSATQRPVVQIKMNGKKGEAEASEGKNYEQVIINLPRDRKTAEWIAVVMTGLLGLVALCIYNGQLVAMLESNSLLRLSTDAATKAAQAAEDGVIKAQESAHLDQRAWVTVKSVTLVKEPALDEEVPADIVFINTGKTPALRVAPASRVFFNLTSAGISAPELHVDPPPGGERSRGVVGPNFDFHSVTRNPPRIENRQQLDDLTKGITTLYVVGFIEYDDIFGQTHHTRFAVSISGKQLGEKHFSSCAIGNTAD